MRAAACACVMLLGCGEPGRGTPSAPPLARAQAPFRCDERAAAAPEGLRRLTMTQYRNTERDLARWALGDRLEADAVVAYAGVEAVPSDRREPTPQDPRGGYRRLDQALEQAHVDETFRVAAALGRALSEPARLARVAGLCAVDEDAGNDEACLTAFIRRFGARALRRPLDADDEAFYRVVYGTDVRAVPAAYGDVITVMLSAPEHLYFVEHGTAEVAGAPGGYQLSAHELAARLSYHFWQTMPDDALWRAAEDGSLLEPAVLAREVERLLGDPRARVTMAELFSDLLGLDDRPEHQPASDEALDMLAYFTWTDPAGIEALFTSELSFARSAELAEAYGVEPWDGASTPPELPAGERPGLLTRAWFLASDSGNTRPIQRGVLIRRRLLCDELAPPPAGANAVVPAPVAGQTTRQAIEELTEQPGTACAGCHAGAINPLGFAFEGFDALARSRAADPAIDTRTVPHVTADDERASSGPADLIQLMLATGKLEACFARHYFRFTFGRTEDLAKDGCALERLRARLADSGRLRDMLEEVALLPELRQRSFGP